MSVGYSTMDRWVRQLRQERNGETSKATPMTPDQLKIRELEKRICQVEMEKDILKKATVDSIDQCNSYVKTSVHRDLLSETYETQKTVIYTAGKSIYF